MGNLNSLHTPSIHILDDDSLLHVFHLYRPLLPEDDIVSFFWERHLRVWDDRDERWWYKLVHVCQRWRNLILGSASYLRLSLVCTYGTPVADMLAHSPPFPIDIDYSSIFRDPTAEDIEGAILALKQHDCVRRVCLSTSLHKLIEAMDGEYPTLDILDIPRLPGDEREIPNFFPETLQVPHLRHLRLIWLDESRLLTTAVDLVTLHLVMYNPLTSLQPNTLLRWLLFMPQLETLAISLHFPVPYHAVEGQPTHTPIMTPVTLSNLRRFLFTGGSTYLEALVCWITAPRLEKLEINFNRPTSPDQPTFLDQPTFPVPCLMQFMNTTENLRFDSVKVGFFGSQGFVKVYPREEPGMHALFIRICCWHFDRQVLSSAAKISNSLSQMFSAVEHLTLEHGWSSGGYNDVDEWHRLLSSFRNVKTLWIDNGLVEELSRCLQLDDGELPLELLPELQELTYFGSGNTFTSFVDSRRTAGRPITLVRRGLSPDPSTSSIAPESSEAGNDLHT
jgi:hypothetical protein